MNKYAILDVEMSYWNMKEVIHPVVLMDDNDYVLVDCGYVGSLPKIEEALHLNAIMPEEITHIILTHQDHDHMGAVAEFKRQYPKVQIMASADEAPYINGERKSLRLIQAEELQKILPAEQQAFGEAFCSLLRRVEPVAVDRRISPNEELPFCGGCRVIATPGHTPGHISLHIPKLDIIIAGDAMALKDGKSVIANPQFTLDINMATSSMDKLLSCQKEKIICYHGGVLSGQALKKL